MAMASPISVVNNAVEIPFANSDALGVEPGPAVRTVVFVGPYEHHSNELPWRESIVDVVTIRENADGLIDLVHLDEELTKFADRPLKIGSFSSASNVTGIGSDTRNISVLMLGEAEDEARPDLG